MTNHEQAGSSESNEWPNVVQQMEAVCQKFGLHPPSRPFDDPRLEQIVCRIPEESVRAISRFKTIITDAVAEGLVEWEEVERAFEENGNQTGEE